MLATGARNLCVFYYHNARRSPATVHRITTVSLVFPEPFQPRLRSLFSRHGLRLPLHSVRLRGQSRRHREGHSAITSLVCQPPAVN